MASFRNVCRILQDSISSIPVSVVIQCYRTGHSSKNAGGQLCSPLRTLCFGEIFCDSSAARRFGLPPCAYRRAEPMSDALHASLWNPYHLITSPNIALQPAVVPWSLRGFLLLNLVVALTTASLARSGMI